MARTKHLSAQAHKPAQASVIADYRRRIISGLVAVIHRGQREGSIEPGLKPETIGKIINAILENSVSPAFALSNDLSLAEINDTLSAMFLRGLFVSKAAPAPGRRRTKRSSQVES